MMTIHAGLEPFFVSGGVLVGLIGIELIGMVVGASTAMALDHLLGFHPELGAAHGPQATGLGALNGWLNRGRVPTLILVILALGGFTAGGVAAVGMADLVGLVLPMWASLLVATLSAIGATRTGSRVVGRLLPKDETYATEPKDHIGCVVEIRVGPAEAGFIAKGRMRDRFGNTQFPSIEPADPKVVLPVGSLGLVIDHRDGILLVVPYPITGAPL